MEARIEQKQRISQALEQRQVLAPALRESLKMLLLSSSSLKDEIDNQLLENPILELEEDDESDDERDFIDFLIRQSTHIGVSNEKKDIIDNLSTPEKSIYDHLNEQLNLSETRKETKALAAYIIGNLDRNGYLVLSTEDVSLLTNKPHDTVLEALRLVQSLDPPGIGCRDLKECLSLQAKGKEDSLLSRVIEDHLDDFSERRFDEIAEHLDITVDRVEELFMKIRSLNPRPGLQIGADLPSEIRYTEPELAIREEKGFFYPVANTRTIPKVKISREYMLMYEKAKKEGRKELEEYLIEKINSAVILMNGIQKRGETLERIGYALIELQADFFRTGGARLKPLKLEEVALKVGCHVSTISRASHEKLVSTPFGIFPLSFFFSSGVAKGKDIVSSRSVKREIRSLLTRENRSSMSDEMIAAALANKGYRVARRTVSKYRKALGIPPAHLRRRMRELAI